MFARNKFLSMMITPGRGTSSTIKQYGEELRSRAREHSPDLIQVREKSLEGRDLLWLTKFLMEVGNVLVNERFDVALAAGAAGVHLTSTGISPRKVRSECLEGFLIGRSTHSLKEVEEVSGVCDYAVFGPVFETESKKDFGTPQGLSLLKTVCEEVSPFPVIAVGGIVESNLKAVLETGAAGFAAIGMYES